MSKSIFITLGSLLVLTITCTNKKDSKGAEVIKTKSIFKENYRPQFHFTPKEKWMNDPNGLIYNKGIYHLFYQYYPDDIVWGPMHWGHAISKDMLHWDHKKIALYPDELGYIFSGSAVLDTNNSSGLGTAETPPLVAIYTYHDADKEASGKDNYQTQGIAYSLDNGDTWTKYDHNPVIGNNGIKDFRDPKVFWHTESGKWILILVAGDHAKIYASDDLKEWTYLSDFGKNQGAHGGVWECPDLFKLKVEGSDEEKWVLVISINPGAPNGGSGTQYFIGDFDGNRFVSEQTDSKWIDYGTDNYAGVTYNNTPNNERIFIGWMSNWGYARDTPTKTWRSAMTLPRRLTLAKIQGSYFLKNYPLPQVATLLVPAKNIIKEVDEQKMLLKHENFNQTQISFTTKGRDYELTFSNDEGDELIVSMNENVFFVDRSKSGLVDFEKSFGEKHSMLVDYLSKNSPYEVKIVLDWSSLEIFINKGQYVMTEQIFPKSGYTNLIIRNKDMSEDKLPIENLKIDNIKSVW